LILRNIIVVRAQLYAALDCTEALIFNLLPYLTGFYESRIRPESQKITQKVAGKKYADPAFTTPALSINRVEFLLNRKCPRSFRAACRL
jgi:hypothetical protein